jgi:hypothetical protein
MNNIIITLFGVAYLLFVCHSCKEENSDSYDLHIQNLKENISKKKEIFGDSLLIYNEYEGKRIGWEYLYKNENLIRKGVRNIDTLENIFYTYSEDGYLKARQVMMYSGILKENVLSEHCGEQFCDLIKFKTLDTIYTNLGISVNISFSLTESLDSFFKTCKVSAIEFTPMGKEKQILFENVSIENRAFAISPSKYGFVVVYFDVQDEIKRTRLFRHVFHIIPKKYEKFDWSFLE